MYIEKEKYEKRRRNRNIAYHVISIIFIIGALLFTVFRFGGVLFRVLETLRDLFVSIAFVAVKLFAPDLIQPTVTQPSEAVFTILPWTWEEFQVCLQTFAKLIGDKYNFFDYITLVLQILTHVSLALLPLAMIITIALLIGWLTYRKSDKEKYAAQEKKRQQSKKELSEKQKERRKKEKLPDSIPLQAFKKFEENVLHPVKDFCVRYLNSFLVRCKGYKIALILIWLWNLNVFSIAIELAAYVFYLVATTDILSLPVYAGKLLLDLFVPLLFLPVIVQLIIGLRVFHVVRCHIGDNILRAFLAKLEALLEKILGAILVVGKQRSRKTTLITVLSLVQANVYRKKAYKGMKKRAKQFPYFPWRNVEDTVRAARAKHEIYTLATCRAFVDCLRRYNYDCGTVAEQRCALKFLKRKFDYHGDNLLFGYDVEKYPTTYNDGRQIIDIFEAIEAYVKLYFIYKTPTSLIYGNYSIRSDEIEHSKGNLEKYNLDMIDRTPADIANHSRYAHYGIGDMMRYGTLMDPKGEYKFALEYGVLAYMEYAKEQGNQETNSGIKKDSKACNRKNDGHSIFLKTVTHMATVDNETYIRPFMDDHRPDSLKADIRELCTLWRIKGKSDSRIVLPGFAFEETLWILTTKAYDWIEDQMSYLHRKNTLLMYLLNKIYMPFNRYCERLANKYSVYTSTVNMWDGADDEVLKNNAKLVIPEFVAFSQRFATDGLGNYFYERAKLSKTGIDDVPAFETEKMTLDEMQALLSHFYNELGELMEIEQFVKAKEELQKWLAEREKKEKEKK